MSRTTGLARRFADQLATAEAAEIVNAVGFNQVSVWWLAPAGRRMQVGPTGEYLRGWTSYSGRRQRIATTMTTFITIGYGDRAGYDRTDPTIRDEAHRHDARLVERGVVMGTAGTPTQVRNHDDAEVVVAEGPFLRSELPVAGFAIIEADSLDEAVALVSKTPCAVAQGVVEVWPLETPG